MRLAPTWMSAMVMLGLAGCASRGNVELLESRLRVQEDQIYQARRELRVARDELTVARREVETLRTQLAERQISTPTPEQLETFSRAETLVVSKLFSGGVDKDGQPGYDVFHTVITPIDAQGELAKVPGAMRLELIDLSRPEGERQLGAWDFTPEECEKHWKKTFFSSGYTFELPWKEPPQSNRVTLYVRLITPDGRQLDASQEVRIAPGVQYAEGKRKSKVSQANPHGSEPSLLLAPQESVPARLAGASKATDASPAGLRPIESRSGKPLPSVPVPPPSADEFDRDRATSAAPVERSGFVRLDEIEMRRPAFPDPEPLPNAGKAKPKSRPTAPPARRATRAATRENLPPPADVLDLPEEAPPARSSVETPSTAPVEEANAVPAPPRPRRAPIPTSDRWTDETRPVLR